MRNAISALSVLAAMMAAALPAAAKEYLLVSTKPNNLVMVDPAARKVVKTHTIAGPGSPVGIVPSPDGKVAYVVTEHLNSLVGIDLDSGAEIFRTHFSDGDLRVRNMFAIDISPDGKELFVLQSAMKKGLGEYQALDPRIAVYRTDAGLDAKPARTLAVPRRTTSLFMAADGTKLYAVSWDINVLDPKDGTVLEVKKVFNRDHPNMAPPDVFGVWSQYEQARMFVTPYTAIRTDMDPTDLASLKTGMLTLDLVNGDFKMAEFEDVPTIMFSSVVNPVRRNESFSVYNTLTKTNLATNRLVKRVPLPHTYYAINISKDGSEVYVAGTMDDIGIYSTKTLNRIGEIKMPGGNDMGTTWIRTVQR